MKSFRAENIGDNDFLNRLTHRLTTQIREEVKKEIYDLGTTREKKKKKLPLFDFLNLKACSRVLATGLTNPRISFCARFLDSISSNPPKIALNFARFNSFPDTSFIRVFSLIIQLPKPSNGIMPSKSKSTVKKHSRLNPWQQIEELSQRLDQRRGRFSPPFSIIAPLGDPAPGGAGAEPADYPQQQSCVHRRSGSERLVLPPFQQQQQQQQQSSSSSVSYGLASTSRGADLRDSSGRGRRRLLARSQDQRGVGSGCRNRDSNPGSNGASNVNVVIDSSCTSGGAPTTVGGETPTLSLLLPKQRGLPMPREDTSQGRAPVTGRFDVENNRRRGGSGRAVPVLAITSPPDGGGSGTSVASPTRGVPFFPDTPSTVLLVGHTGASAPTRPSCVRLGDTDCVPRDGSVPHAPVLAGNQLFLDTTAGSWSSPPEGGRSRARSGLRVSWDPLAISLPSACDDNPVSETPGDLLGNGRLPEGPPWAPRCDLDGGQSDSYYGQPRLAAPEWLPGRQWAQLPGSDVNTAGARAGSLSILRLCRRVHHCPLHPPKRSRRYCLLRQLWSLSRWKPRALQQPRLRAQRRRSR